MNRVDFMSLAAVCGALAQPAAMAETFIQSPAPVICRSDADILSPANLADFIEQLSIGKSLVTSMTENADDLYFYLVEMNTDDAKVAFNASDIKHFQATELFLRGFEIEISSMSEREGMPDFIATEMKSYYRLIAKARSVVTRLNGYVKQLTQEPKTFQSEINFEALRELASSTSDKLSSKPFH